MLGRLGSICIALCAVQVISYPLSDPSYDNDSKVMKCIEEVISHSVLKPSTTTISEECRETLKEDDRIISILRHQNLLKELQNLAAEGATRLEQKKKKSGDFKEKYEELPVADEKASRSDTESKRQIEEVDGKGDSEQETHEGDSEELESNEVSKREEVPDEEKIDNHITDEINEGDMPKEPQKDTSSEEDTHVSLMGPKDTENMESAEKENLEKENPEETTNETDDEEDETQREDKSLKPEQDQDFDKEDITSETESSKEGGHPDDETMQGGGNSHQKESKSEEETSSNEMEDSKRWNKMDELAKQLTSKKWAEENTSEGEADQSMKISSREQKYHFGGLEQDDKQSWPQSGEDSTESEFQVSKRPEPEVTKDEEESSFRKTEGKDLDSIAAIEAELEKVAHKLHELRQF
ncbi:hypothetical protein GDO86_015965 [Hymenochirus boettgeri]|uniref:Chromogranin-A n=1 Tax=Hymenochirus boettgeri TaxID=247094 RepID=A0A8T2JV40_9PIPI|nr:hypothetical protein GDO86_015965 [Hymenochirus boettgeri]